MELFFNGIMETQAEATFILMHLYVIRLGKILVGCCIVNQIDPEKKFRRVRLLNDLQ